MKRLLGSNDIKTYMGISLPSIVMVMAEWIGVEILIVIATFISIDASSAMSVSYNFHNCIYMIPYGFQLAMTAVIGNFVGAGDEAKGKLIALMGIVQICIITVICGLLTHVYAEQIAGVYTSDTELIANLVPLLK